jgi:PAS domain-containing protein
VINVVCETLRWDCGQYFQLERSTATLYLAAAWGNPTDLVAEFMEKSRGAKFRIGAGLAGRVCESGEPLWILSESSNSRTWPLALAHEISSEGGLSGAFVFPVSVANETLGVLSFASRIVREPDDRLLRTVRSIGTQLGQFLRQRQAQDTLRQSELRFRRLTELTSDWIWEQDCDFRFTKIIGAGVTGTGCILGKTLWESPTVLLDDDDWVKHKSELAAHWSFCDFNYAVLLPDGRRHYYRISGEPLYDAVGIFSGFHGTGLDITQYKRDELA